MSKKLFLQSLSTRFLIFSFLSILLPISLVNIFSYYTTRAALIETVMADNTSLVLSMTNEIRNDVFTLKDTLKTAGLTLAVADDLDEKKSILIALAEGSSVVKSLALLDDQGQELIRSDDRDVENKRNSPEFYIAREENYYISSADYNRTEKKSSINISAALSEGSDFKGVLVAEISADSIWERMRMMTLGSNDSSYVFTQAGQLVAQSVAAEDALQVELERISLRDSLERDAVTEEIRTVAGDMLKITTPVPGLDWQITVFRPLEDLYKNINLVKNEVFVITLSVLLMVTVVTMIFARSIISPIYNLYKKSKSITSLSGKRKTVSEENQETGNEIELLSRQFDVMAEGLKKYYADLEESKKVLEIKVKARTKELEEMAKHLEETVEQRTKELKERLAELEKFHKLTVGRELRMIQLKKELEKLKKGKPKTNKTKKKK